MSFISRFAFGWDLLVSSMVLCAQTILALFGRRWRLETVSVFGRHSDGATPQGKNLMNWMDGASLAMMSQFFLKNHE